MKRLFLVVVVFVSPMVSFAEARKWTSRDGNSTVEAELVDVKGGNAVLKKPDGSQILMPLSKLSLGDLRYVRSELRAAEDAVTGGKTEAARPAPVEPQSTAPAAKPADLAAAAKKLHYAWKKDRTFTYHVRLIGERGNDTENRSGNVTYRVKSTQFSETQLAMTSDLKYANILRSRRYTLLPDGHVGFVSDVDKRRETRVRIDSHGRILESRGEAPLPYLLGDLAELIVEPLPQTEEVSWTIASDPGLAVVSAHYPYCRASRAVFREGIPAVEKTVFTLRDVAGDLIVIAKHYEMTSAATLGGKPRIEAVGDGTLKFDTQRNVFASLDFDMRVTVRDSNKSEETPLHLSYRLLSEQDIAEAAADEKKEKEEADKALKERLRPLTDKEIETTLADLATGDSQRISGAIRLLTGKKPQQPNAKVATALESLMLHGENPGVRSEAARALNHWSTEQSIPSLLKALDDSWPPVQSNALEALSKYTPKEAIRPAARLLISMMTRRSAEKFLKAVGPDAEEAVLAQINVPDHWVRASVCELLGSLGTKKSISALSKAVFDENWMVNGNARKALAAVKAREETKTTK